MTVKANKKAIAFLLALFYAFKNYTKCFLGMLYGKIMTIRFERREVLMKIIVGLGNPGKPYEHTRHNIGFDVIDALAEKWGTPLTNSKFNGMYTTVHRPEGKVLLVKPLTYMNLSGNVLVP